MTIRHPEHGFTPTGTREDEFTWKPLRLLTFYRLILAGLLTTIFFAAPQATALGSGNAELFAATILAYLCFGLVAGFAARWRWPAYALQVLGQISVDVIAITLLMHASGSLGSGLGVLLAVAVAAGSLLLPGRLAYLFAALATLAVLAEQAYGSLLGAAIAGDDYTRAGLFGAAFFATASLAHMLARRVRESEDLAARRGIDVANLEALNAYIIQHLQSGVVVVDQAGKVRLVNELAWRLLGMPGRPTTKPLAALAPQLAQSLAAWRRQPERPPAPFRSPAGGTAIVPNFTPLGMESDTGAIIFLEDMATMAQRSQQLKLAALGRLTASIAHEIRNPLGAISHAGQLLDEAPDLATGDRRLVEIIREQCERMNTIVENVLQLSRREPAQPQAIGLGTWLENFVGEFSQYEHVPAGRIEFQVQPDDSHIQFDPTHLHQVIWNLCKNALEHGGAKDTPHVVLRGGAGDSTQSRPYLEVIDNGPGIPPEAESQMFEPFFTTNAGGTGLGLYISRELCERNQAELSYRPVTSGGSCFRIDFSNDADGGRS